MYNSAGHPQSRVRVRRFGVSDLKGRELNKAYLFFSYQGILDAVWGILLLLSLEFWLRAHPALLPPSNPYLPERTVESRSAVPSRLQQVA